VILAKSLFPGLAEIVFFPIFIVISLYVKTNPSNIKSKLLTELRTINGFTSSILKFQLRKGSTDNVLIMKEADPQIEASLAQFITFVTILALIDINDMVAMEKDKRSSLTFP